MNEKPEAIQFADDRPSSWNVDDLYQWATDAEELIRSMQARITVLEKDAERLDWMDAQVKHHQYYTGYEWQENGYENDRGLTCKIQTKKNLMSARKAIDTAMQKD